jgi:hypothetical protein
MAVLKQSPLEMEIVTDLMLDDQVRLTKTARGELEIVIHNPQGGINGTEMVAATVLSAAEIRAIKAWL